MTIKTLYPHTVSQTSDSETNFREFNNLGNIKNNNNTYAKTGVIASKSGTHKRPSTITAKNFKANIPAGSKINSVTVEYAADYEGNISIGKPTINILNITGDNKKGKALTKTMTRSSANWKGNHIISNMNSSDFGVTISFPANTKADTGYVKVKYVRVIIDYTAPKYTVHVSHIQGNYVEDTHKIKVTANNINKTNGDSNVTIRLPAGVTYVGKDSGDGTITKKDNQTLTWKPGISNKKLNSQIVFNCTVSAIGTYKITSSEAVTNNSAGCSFQVETKPNYNSSEEIIEDDYQEESVTPTITPEKSDTGEIPPDDYFDYIVPIYVKDTDYVTINTSLPPISFIPTPGDSMNVGVWVVSDIEHLEWCCVGEGIWRKPCASTTGSEGYHTSYAYRVDPYPNVTVRLRNPTEEWGSVKIRVMHSQFNREYGFNARFVVTDEKINSLGTPNFNLMEIKGEELDRLGDGEAYTAQSWLKVITDNPLIKNLRKNFRIGIFNNKIEANCSTYYLQASVNPYLDGEIRLSSKYDITDGYLKIKSADNSIILKRGKAGYYTITTSEWTTVPLVGDHIFLIEFLQDIKSICNLIIQQYTSDDTLVDTLYYRIQFNAEEDIPLREVEEDSTDYNNLTKEQIFKNAISWGNNLQNVNTFESLNCDFVYDKKYPLYILLVGTFEDDHPDEYEVRYSEPCIVESDVYTGQEQNGNYPIPILSMVNNEAEEPSIIKLESFEESTHVILYNPSLSENYGTDDSMAIRGIGITGDIEFSDNLILFAKLKIYQDNEYLIGNRSVIVNSEDDSLSIGGLYDTWGIDISKLTNLDKLELELGVNNILEENDASIILRNIQITIYSNDISRQTSDVIVEDENVAWYGMDITNIEIPFGRNTETKYLNIEGTDANIPHRQNVRGKHIKIYFEVDGCDLLETTAQVQQLAKLFTNERDELNAPIPKKIQFGHVPGKFFYYILEDTFDTDIKISDYKGSIEIFIPDGTAFDVEDTVTNVTGYVDSIVSVNPLLELTHISDDCIIISELTSNQSLKINKNNLSNADILFDVKDKIIVNCITRECILIKSDNTEIDITESVDYNSDWFKIQGEYEFKSENCVIQTVTYNVRS